MSEGFRTYEGVGGLVRPIIPTPHASSTSLRVDPIIDLENNALLKHYYQNYLRLMKENGVLTNQLRIINGEKDELRERFQQLRSEDDLRKKRHRRTAGEISRSFECPITECARSYGSEGSLLQHIKIKHQEFYQSEQYEALLLSKQKKRGTDGG